LTTFFKGKAPWVFLLVSLVIFGGQLTKTNYFFAKKKIKKKSPPKVTKLYSKKKHMGVLSLIKNTIFFISHDFLLKVILGKILQPLIFENF
jgi:hypothetical protein